MNLEYKATKFKTVSDIKIPDIFYRRYKSGISVMDELFGEGILPTSPEINTFIDDKMAQRRRMTKDMQRTIDSFQSALGITRNKILNEEVDNPLSAEETFEVDLESLEEAKTDE